MKFSEVSLIQIFLLVGFIGTCLADGSYDDDNISGFTQKCTCYKESTNGTFCEQQTCETVYHRANVNVKCFSGRSLVQKRDGTLISLAEINIGDKVLVFNGKNLVYEPIYDIIHMEKNNFYRFLQLTVLNDRQNSTHSIEITHEHLIFKYGTLEPIFAREIQIGDFLQLADRYELIPGKVIAIDEITSQGYSAPLTPSGTIVVNQLLSSNYAHVKSHYLAHLAMQPYRLWRWTFGPKQIIESDLHGFISILFNFADKTGLLHLS